jgi:hypothetical protein
VAWDGNLLPKTYSQLKATQSEEEHQLLPTFVDAYANKKFENLDVLTCLSLTTILKYFAFFTN